MRLLCLTRTMRLLCLILVASGGLREHLVGLRQLVP
jgi:hypothetical protein